MIEIEATITYKDGTKATYSTIKKSLFKDKTFLAILRIQDYQIRKIEVKEIDL